MTTPYHLLISPHAEEHILSLPHKYQKLLLKLIEALSINPRPPGSKKLGGMMGLYSHQINHMRLIYKIEEHDIIMLVIK